MQSFPGFLAKQMPGTEVRYCYGRQMLGQWVTWRMDEDHHGYGSERYFPSESQARKDVAKRVRFHRSMIRAK